MAARAIVGILIGILFAPVIYILLMSIATPTAFSTWFWSMLSDFTGFITTWMNSGIDSTVAPLISYGAYTGTSLIDGFGPTYGLLAEWLPTYAPALITWTVIGAWSGAIERSAGRGIGVGVGCWLGWLIIGVIGVLLIGLPIAILDLIIAQLMTVIVVIVVAAIFGAMTKSEEF